MCVCVCVCVCECVCVFMYVPKCMYVKTYLDSIRATDSDLNDDENDSCFERRLPV